MGNQDVSPLGVKRLHLTLKYRASMLARQPSPPAIAFAAHRHKLFGASVAGWLRWHPNMTPKHTTKPSNSLAINLYNPSMKISFPQGRAEKIVMEGI